MKQLVWPTLESDVYIWYCALLVVHARKEEEAQQCWLVTEKYLAITLMLKSSLLEDVADVEWLSLGKQAAAEDSTLKHQVLWKMNVVLVAATELLLAGDVSWHSFSTL